MAQKGDELLIVEMKTSFNLQLVYQLIERLKITDKVYACVPLGKGGRWPKAYKRMCGLLKRLHCGLITLDQHTKKKIVVEFEPTPFKSHKNYTKKNLALKEFTSTNEHLLKALVYLEMKNTVDAKKDLEILINQDENTLSKRLATILYKDLN